MSDIRLVQKRLLEMGNTIAGILDKHGIQYMIAFGSLLGAVRHEGFIPWDDDFDLFLFDDTYDSTVETLRKELPDNLFVEDEKSEPLFFHGWARVKDLKSEVDFSQFPQDGVYAHHGLCVDLFRCKKMKMADLCEWRKKQARAYLERRLLHNFITKDEYEQKLAVLTANIINEERETVTSNTEIFAMAVKDIKCDDVFPLKKYKFDDYTFVGPNNADSILTHFYGDYMKLPKEEDRIPHYSSVEFED